MSIYARSLLVLLTIAALGCKKQADVILPVIPEVTTFAAGNVTATSAECGGMVTSEGATPVTLRGVCWRTTQHPTILDACTSDGAGPGSFKSILTNLAAKTTYYVRSYAINEAGTGYGNQVVFTTPGGSGGDPCAGQTTLTDPRDHQAYPVTRIGDQCWMQKNLDYEAGVSWCYADNIANCETYGRLYDWNTAMMVCPPGWHLPGDPEWAALADFLGGEHLAGEAMKSDSGWSYNGNGTNSSGFAALPGGNAFRDSSFNGLGSRAYFWTSTELSQASAWNRHLYSGRRDVSADNYAKTHGFSVRCIKD